MTDPDESRERHGRRSILDRIFPLEHDFLQMLVDQAEQTRLGVEAFVAWLDTGCVGPPDEVRRIEREQDRMRYELEEALIDAFSTPFDREDLYSLSRQMDYILNFAAETAREIHAFGVTPDRAIVRMARLLLEGTHAVVEGVGVMTTDEPRVRENIREGRAALHRIEDAYIDGLAEIFHGTNAMEALRRREIYHHLRDGGRALRGTLDVLHRAVVGLK
ncbi:MAG TPA: DUF47 family protein [Methanoregulaceae archaeon]|nr:DUF47 family protein [Methanoregulaceae archaeon]